MPPGGRSYAIAIAVLLICGRDTKRKNWYRTLSKSDAITVKDNLRKAIKEGKTACGAIVSNIERVINEGLLEFLELPGDTVSDHLHALITLPLDKGGLNCKIHEVDALLGISPSVQLKFRNLVHQAKQGSRSDLEPKKVEVQISPEKKQKTAELHSSQKAVDRAASRAIDSVPELEELFEEGLVSKKTASKIGQVIKNSEQPSEKEQEIMAKQQQVQEKLQEILPNPLPQDTTEKKKLRQEVKEVIEEVSGLKTSVKVTLHDDVSQFAKEIALARPDVDYLQELIVALEFEVEDLNENQQSEMPQVA